MKGPARPAARREGEEKQPVMSANPLSWADVIVLAKALGKQDDALTPASVMEKYIAPLNAGSGRRSCEGNWGSCAAR